MTDLPQGITLHDSQPQTNETAPSSEISGGLDAKPTETKHADIESDYVALDLKKIQQDIDSLLIYTKAVKWPTIYQLVSEKRFLLRVAQLLFGLGMYESTLPMLLKTYFRVAMCRVAMCGGAICRVAMCRVAICIYLLI